MFLLTLECGALFGLTKNVIIKCNNLAVVTILNTGTPKDYMLATMARNMWLETASQDIRFQSVHIPGKLNTCADLLVAPGVNQCGKIT